MSGCGCKRIDRAEKRRKREKRERERRGNIRVSGALIVKTGQKEIFFKKRKKGLGPKRASSDNSALDPKTLIEH